MTTNRKELRTHEMRELCRGCFITQAVPKRDQDLLKRADFRPVDTTENNVILREILTHSLSEGQRFTVLARGNRYGIKVFKKRENMFYLTQEYLHLDSRNRRLVPVQIRLVKIEV